MAEATDSMVLPGGHYARRQTSPMPAVAPQFDQVIAAYLPRGPVIERWSGRVTWWGGLSGVDVEPRSGSLVGSKWCTSDGIVT